MIERTQGYRVGDKLYATIEEAQKDAIKSLIADGEEFGPTVTQSVWFSEKVIEHRERLLDILTTTAKSKPKARAINGGRKPRKAKPSGNSLFHSSVVALEEAAKITP